MTRSSRRSKALEISRLLRELAVAKGDGRYERLLDGFAKTDVSILDDWGLEAPNADQRRVLLEWLDERYDKRGTVFTSQ